MNRETGAWLAVALPLYQRDGRLGDDAESTMATDANDVIDLDYDQVPIGQDTASNVLDEIEGDQREGRAREQYEGEPREQRDSTSSKPAESQSSNSSKSKSTARTRAPRRAR